MQQPQHIGLIGAGNIAASIVQGLVAAGYPANRISATVRSEERAQAVRRAFGINVSTDNQGLVGDSDILILAVKPQQMRELAQEIAPIVQIKKPLIISVAVGVTIDSLQTWLGGGPLAIVRSMPNTPALIGAGASGLFANAEVTDAQRESATSIHRAVGLVVWLANEEQMNAVAALSGSGPAYFFYFIEAMERAGVTLGLDPEVARLLSLQTALGASRLAAESEDDVVTLRKKVTSPKGTTEKAINVFETENLFGIVEEAMQAATQWGETATHFMGMSYSPRVLFVEDSIMVKIGTISMLESLNATVDAVDSGEEAIECIKRQDYDLVFMDVGLPSIDGYEAARRIRALEKGKTVPIIAITAHVIGDINVQYDEVGVNDAVPKPLTPEDVLRFFNIYLASKGYVMNEFMAPPKKEDPYKHLFDMDKSMVKLGSEAAVGNYLKSFVVYLSESLALITLLEEKKDSIALVKEAHKLRGALSFIEAPELNKAVIQLGNGLKIGQRGDIPALLAEVFEAADIFKKHVARFFSD